MKMLKENIVSVDWLHKNRHAKNLLIFDATIKKVTDPNKVVAEEEFIKEAVFFDIKKVFSEQTAVFPNTLLSPEKFELAAQKLGVSKNSCIVVYDAIGIYSSARVWWMFKTMGFDSIAVLDGGFPAWKEAKFPTSKKHRLPNKIENFTAKYQQGFICDTVTVSAAISTEEIQIVDARSKGRFEGTTPEPRKEIRSGHIPTSISLPYTELLVDGKIKSSTEIKRIFKEINPKQKPLIFSCGSGITACVLALGAEIANSKKIMVYDGSWTEWGSRLELPIENKKTSVP